MLETYFKNGGIHFQLNHVSREELLNAKATPEKYKNLKVRVTGYSDYFTRLEDVVQDSIIRRYQNGERLDLLCKEFHHKYDSIRARLVEKGIKINTHAGPMK